MKRFSEQLKKKASGVKLQAAEKRELHARVVAYMEYHPLTSATAATTTKSAPAATASAEAFQVVHISRWFARGFGGFVALFLILIPVLAERSVPGDSLYAVKVNVNEEVWSTLAFSSFEKIEWETRRLERRIAEAQTLARSGRLTPEVEATVVDAVEEHRRSATVSIDKLRTIDAEQASLAEITLSTVLDVQSAKLDSNNLASSTAGHSTAALAKAVAESREEAAIRSANADISFDRLMAYVEQETTRTYELLDSINSTAEPAQIQAVERRLRDIERSIASVVAARADLETNDTAPVVAVSIDVATTTTDTASTTATSTTVVSTTTEQVVATEAELVSELRLTFKAIQKLIAYMTDIDLQSTVLIETLVPVVQTDEEAQAEAKSTRATLLADIAEIAAATPRISSDSIQEKIEVSVGTVNRLLAESDEAMAAGDWERVKALHAEAQAFVESMQKIFTLEDVPMVPPAQSTSSPDTTASSTDDMALDDTADDESETNDETNDDSSDQIEDNESVASTTAEAEATN